MPIAPALSINSESRRRIATGMEGTCTGGEPFKVMLRRTLKLGDIFAETSVLNQQGKH